MKMRLPRRIVGLSRFPILLGLMLAVMPLSLWAAPFAKYVQFTQPGGVGLTLWGEGDDFRAVFETATGYTVIYDAARRAYFYANLAADRKSLVSTGVLAHLSAPTAIRPHLRIDAAADRAAAQARRKKWDDDLQQTQRWKQLKSLTLGTPVARDALFGLPSPPTNPTTGSKVGLTLLIDFSDDPATIPQSEIEAFCNSDSYSGYGNNGSVKKYFQDVSAGRLTYTNVVTLYVRMVQPKSYYNNTSVDAGLQARLLINDAFTILKARSDYANTILPTFAGLTVDGSNQAVALNVFYAGGNGNVWSFGLWPHAWALASPIELGNGKSVRRYQVTNLGSSMQLGTFCHENGHLLCGFPDIYDYDYDSKGGAGLFCLMNSGGHGTNPAQVCAYLKLAAGWATVTELNGAPTSTNTVAAAPNSGYDRFFRYRRPGVNTEYYLLENRQRIGRDLQLPASGIAIWHCDELGDHDDQRMIPNSAHQNYEVTLVQADNLWHFQNNINSGDAADLYYLGNPATAYSNQLTDSSTPHARWWDGTASALKWMNFSVAGPSMAFVHNGPDPLITTQPISQGFDVGNTIIFSVTASGTAPFSYQWHKNGVLIPGATASSHVISNVQVAAAGVYTVLVSNSVGSILSDPATLSRNSAPVVLTAPANVTATAGLPVTFTATFTGVPMPTYQWRRNGADIIGATSNTLPFANVQTANEGSYELFATNGSGTVGSRAATLVVKPAGSTPSNDNFANAWVLTGPRNQAVGTNVGATGEAGEPTLITTAGTASSVWYFWTATSSGTAIVDTIGSSFDTVLAVYTGTAVNGLTWIASDDDDGGNYTSKVTFAATANTTYRITVGSYYDSSRGSIKLNVANGAPPTISDIASQTVSEDTATGEVPFIVGDAETPAGSLVATGNSSNVTLVPNANIVFGGSGANRTVVVTPAANQFGTANITVTVSDGVLSASDVFVLTVNAVNDAPTISDIANQTVNAGGNTGGLPFAIGDVETAAASLTVSGSSSNTTLIPNANIVFGGSGGNRTVTVTPASGQTGTATITVTVSDGALAVSDTFGVTVNAVAPVIVVPPRSTTVAMGETAMFSVLASGTPPLSYQWRKGSTNLTTGGRIAGANSAMLTISNVEVSDVGTYSVVVSNGTGNTPSNVVDLALRGQGTAGSQFVAVGANGTILSSPDGLTWTSRTSGVTKRLRSVVASGNVFVVVGESGTVLTSPDGVIWTNRNAGTTENLRGVVFGMNQYIAVGGVTSAVVLSSPDGVTWNQVSGVPGSKLRAVTWGGGQFVAVGHEGTVLTSPDGVAWTARTASTTSRLDGVVWTGSQFRVVSEWGTVYTSTDAVNWTSALGFPLAWLEGLVWSEARGVAVGALGTIVTSTNGTAWSAASTGTTALLHGVTWSGVSASVATLDPINVLGSIIMRIVTGPRDAVMVAGGTATFSVVAAGPGTLSYAWYFTAQGTTTPVVLNDVAGRLSGTHSANLTVANVQAADVGDYVCVVNSGIGAPVTSDAALLSIVARVVKVVSQTAAPGAQVVVPVQLLASGIEAGVGFSVNFNATHLTFVAAEAGAQAGGAAINVNSSLAGSGKVGIAMAKSTGTWTAGTNEIVKFTFTLGASVPNATNSPLTFGDTPIIREVVSGTADVLPAGYQDGAITVASGYEADMNASGAVTISDWVRVGRIVSGLDPRPTGVDFLKADCSPRMTSGVLTLGGGTLTIADWVQAGRYASGLDPLTEVGGPPDSTP